MRVGGLDVPGLLLNFVRAASGDEALLAPASEGMGSIELATALITSGLAGRTVELDRDNEPHPRISETVRPS